MAKGKSLIDWCNREMEFVTSHFCRMGRIPDEYYLANNMIQLLGNNARNKEIIDKATEIVQKWINFEPTTPILGTDDEWDLIAKSSAQEVYANNRYFALFKTVEKKGFEEKVTYSDRNRIECDYGDIGSLQGIKKGTSSFEDYAPFIREKIDELIPITFPYIPEKIKVEISLIKPKDNKLYFHFKTFSRNDGKSIDLHKYFCYAPSLGFKSWEISRDKYIKVFQEYLDGPFWSQM